MTQQTTAGVPHPSHRDEWDVRRQTIMLAAALAFAIPAPAQQLIGYVSTKDADVSGASDIMDGHAVLSGAVAVTAKDHTAPITLGRGGTVRVCQTSVLHLTQSRAATLAAPLLLSLDRGAVEIRMAVTSTDAVMTPDLRLAALTPGPLDLHLRVARNGDTCVENRGAQAPTLAISDTFGESRYQLLPNQHVLFEHGSLHEVVDHETTPCGCPDTATGMSIAEALLAPGAGTAAKPATPAAQAAAAQNPFPTAVSEGLAPAAEVPQAPPGEIHAQVTGNLAYSAPAAVLAEPARLPPPATIDPPPAAAPEQRHGPLHAIGHFFHKLFTGN
jgi:hypothetical protein